MPRIHRLFTCGAVLVIGVLHRHSWAHSEIAQPSPTAEAPAAADAPAPAGADPTTESPPAGSSPLPESVSPAPLSTVLQGKAKSDYDTGRLLSDSGDFAGARLKFQSAYQEAGDPRLLWNAAACERNLHHYANAIVLVQRFLASNSPFITPELASRARAFLDAAEPLTAPLEVESNQPSSQVYVDDQNLGALELVLGVRLDIGTHRVAVEEVGFQPYAETVTVTGSAPVTVKAILRPIAFAMPVDPSAPQRDVAASASHSSALPKWVWVAGGCVVLAGVATASYFIFKPADAPEPNPGSITTLLRF